MKDRRSTPFRVIVVGGGVAGLTAAHRLHAANIDHVVLERGSDPAPPTGASIAIYPHGARILKQIGCLQAAKDACSPMTGFVNRMPDGRSIVDSKFFDYISENHGQEVLVLERRAFLRILYEGLPDRSRVRLGTKVTEIHDGVDGVEARLADGTNEWGDMIIGCDGVHSMVRETMWDQSNKSATGLVTVKEKKSVTTGWSCLIGMGPRSPAMGDRTMTCVHDRGYSFLILTQPEKVFFFVFFRLKKPFTWPNRKRYTDEDANGAAAKVADHPISETTVFGELWEKRTRGSLISLEEGILQHWHFGRIVLAGDSAHKITPNIALGGNSSMESITVLCNHLHRTLAAHAGTHPSRATLNALFAAYQEERKPRMKAIMTFSSTLTKLQAWDNALLRFMATWVVPYQPDRRIADQLGEIIRWAPKLDYVDVGPDFERGKVAWSDESGVSKSSKASAAVKAGMKGRIIGLRSSSLLPLAGAVAGLLSLIWVVIVR